MSGPLKGAQEVSRAPAPQESSVGLLSEGGMVGHVSALFGLPEPFTAVTNEPVSVYWVSIGDRPFSSWPKDILTCLEEGLRSRIDWYLGRARHLRPQTLHNADSSPPHKDAPRRSPAEWKVSDSRFLRNKELCNWRIETIRDVYDAEGWTPSQPTPTPSPASITATLKGGGTYEVGNLCSSPVAGASRTVESPAQARVRDETRSLPRAATPVSTKLTREPRSEPALARPSSSAASAGPRTPGGLVPAAELSSPTGERGTYNVNSGIGRCKTPWGTWSPSGMLPPAAPTSGPAEKLLQKAKARRKVPTRHARGIEEKKSIPLESAEGTDEPEKLRDLPEQPGLNLRCERDWRRIRAVASTPALEKMYKRQVRANMVANRSAAHPGAK